MPMLHRTAGNRLEKEGLEDVGREGVFDIVRVTVKCVCLRRTERLSV